MKLNIADTGEGYSSLVVEADYGNADTIPVDVHASHVLHWSPGRGWTCLGCETKASWPLARSVCPQRASMIPSPTSVDPVTRKRASLLLRDGLKPAEVAKRLGITRMQADGIARAVRTDIRRGK